MMSVKENLLPSKLLPLLYRKSCISLSLNYGNWFVRTVEIQTRKLEVETEVGEKRGRGCLTNKDFNDE